MSAVRNKNINPETEKRGTLGALLFAILFAGMAILTGYVVFLKPDEGMLSGMRGVLTGLCGHLMYAAPAVFVWLCVLCGCRAAGRRVAIWRVLANMALIICAFSAVELFFLDNVELASSAILSWMDFVVKAYRYGAGGGAVGALLGAAIYPYLGTLGGLIAVIVLATILMAITGKLGAIARFVSEKNHDHDQRRLQRRNDEMFEPDERTMLDREFEEAAARRHAESPRQVFVPDRQSPAARERTTARGRSTVSPEMRAAAERTAEAAVAPDEKPARRRKLYQEDIAAEPETKKAEDLAFESKDKPVKVRTSRQEQKKREAELDELFDIPEEEMIDTSAAAEEIKPAAKAAEPAPAAEKPARKPAKAARAEREEAAKQGQLSMDDLRIEPDEYEEKDEESDHVFQPDPAKLPKLKRKEPAAAEEEEYNYPPIDLLAMGNKEAAVADANADMQKAKLLEDTLRSFGIQTKLTGIAHGPAVTRFELQPAPGVKVSRITSLADDIALNLAAISVRIEAPIPGKAAVGVEVPNDKIETVSLRHALECQDARKHASRIAVGLGKDNSGRYIVADIAKMPHVLIAGQTGSGKSVCINSIIVSILFRATPDEVKLILIDPKVVELSVYNGIPHLIAPVVTDPKKAASALDWAVVEMTGRYKKFAERGVRDIKGYNKALREGEKPMPHMVIIIDELADLMMVCPGEVEDSICRLAQLARAAGMHLVIATQRPSVNVITGIIKANIPSRIAFLVASQVDSRTIIDHGGAEKLLGHGDMLYVPSGIQKPMRVQGSWVSDEEVHAVVEYIKERHETAYDEDVLEHINNATTPDAEKEKASEEYDPRLPEAIEIVLEAGQASVSMLQRRMRVGYARAGRLIDDMYQRGIVSEADGAKPRAVLITREQFNQMFDDGETDV